MTYVRKADTITNKSRETIHFSIHLSNFQMFSNTSQLILTHTQLHIFVETMYFFTFQDGT